MTSSCAPTTSRRGRTAGASASASPRPARSAASRASAAISRPAQVVYAGDGHSDLCAALAADRVFATGSLARWLRERGVPFATLTDFRALALAL